MHIDRPMATLFFQIKRSIPFELREQMKLSSPDVGERLVSMYKKSNDDALKSMIEDFMIRAGGTWKDQLDADKRSTLLGAIMRRVKH